MTDDVTIIAHFTELIRWGGVVSSLFVVAAAWVTLRIIHRFVENLGTRFTGKRLFFQKTETFFQFFIYITVAVTVIFLSLRIDEKVLALIGGTVAVAVGFALKDLFASFIAGVVIMFDRPFQVGDRVQFGGEYGDITAIGLRSIKLQTLDDNTVTIPNNKVMNEVTSSGNFGELDMQVVIDAYIGIDQDVKEGCRIMKEAALSSRYSYLSKPTSVIVSQVVLGNTVAIRLRLKSYVMDTKYEKAFETDVLTRAMHAMRTLGIAPPALLQRDA